MRIHIKTDERELNLILPLGVLLNRLTAQAVAGRANTAARKNGGAESVLSGAQMNRLFREIKHHKKKHPDWVFVEVQTHNGETITIT